MFRRTFVFTACAVAVATLVTTSSAQAQFPLMRVNYLTFTTAVALPGVVLAPGKYAFESGPGHTDRDLVRVISADRQRTHFLAFTKSGPRPTNIPPAQLVSFGEASGGAPTPIKAWYPIGSPLGHEFRW